MQRPQVQFRGRSDLDDTTKVHHRDPRRDVFDDSESMRDEEIGESKFLLQVLEQIDYLGLD